MSLFNDIAQQLARSQKLSNFNNRASSFATSFGEVPQASFNPTPNNRVNIDRASSYRYFQQTLNPLMGYITPAEAKAIYDSASGIHYAHKNLFLIEISDMSARSGDVDITRVFNLFCTNLSYSPITIPSERENIGTATIDKVATTEPVEMQISTMDDYTGTVKRWFHRKAARVASKHGIAGLPIDYLVRIRVLHSFIKDSSHQGEGFDEAYIMRPVSLEVDHSRREDELQELNMAFTQFDTFFPV